MVEGAKNFMQPGIPNHEQTCWWSTREGGAILVDSGLLSEKGETRPIFGSFPGLHGRQPAPGPESRPEKHKILLVEVARSLGPHSRPLVEAWPGDRKFGRRGISEGLRASCR